MAPVTYQRSKVIIHSLNPSQNTLTTRFTKLKFIWDYEFICIFLFSSLNLLFSNDDLTTYSNIIQVLRVGQVDTIENLIVINDESSMLRQCLVEIS